MDAIPMVMITQGRNSLIKGEDEYSYNNYLSLAAFKTAFTGDVFGDSLKITVRLKIENY